MIGEKLGPYEIIESIGSGGMGEVWKARDTRLGRIVAIKKVKEQHSERFKKEARSVAALNHPNICQLFDIGDDYLVLEYVEGRPLSSPLPEQEAIHLAIQIATALEEAHQHGIIHRDLKPSNIMVTDKGSIKLLDFGLAKLYEQDSSLSGLPTADFPATQAGAVLGTVAYMSPEQAQGRPVDVRSDIFSFGLVLYEMLSGRRAFAGDSNYAVMDAIVKKEPAPLQASPALEKIVRWCLEKDPSDRYQTIAEVKAAVEKAAENKVTVSSEEPQPSIAVLPFADMSPGKDNEWFSDGLAEEIINALTKIPGLQVIARTSAFAFKGKDQDITKIAEALRVSNILEGSVRKSGDRIRVTAQLIEASKGIHLWSERYDRELTDVFAIQDEISQAIARKLRVHLSMDRPLVKHRTKNIEAYNLLLKGRYHQAKYTPDSLARAKSYYEQAIAIDPDYASVWNELANFNFHMGGIYGYMRPQEAYEECSHAIEKVLELDETLPEIYAYRGILQAIHYDWIGAKKNLQHALDLESGAMSLWVWLYYGFWYLMPLRRFDEALAAMRKALELDPLSPWTIFCSSYYYYVTRQWDRAIEQCHETLELDPKYYLAYQFLGFTYFQKGELEEGIRACEMAAQLVGQSPWAVAFRAIACAKAGRIDEAKRCLDELLELSQKSYISPIIFSWIYCSLGEIDQAVEWTEKSMEEHSLLILHLHIFPLFDPLRSHPRYKALLRKMKEP